MIPKIFIFKGTCVEQALEYYYSSMPAYLKDFEKQNGVGVASIVSIYHADHVHYIIASIWQDKVKLEAIEAAKRITDTGSGIMNQLDQRLQNIFNSEGCEHEYDSVTDDKGNTKIVCNKCGTPLG